MSFTSSARTVRDLSRPLGCRVSALHQCIEDFSPFGFQDTRLQLRAVLGVTDHGWTEAQLQRGLGLLEQARRSWVAARDGADPRTYQPENRYNRPLPEGGVAFPVWLATYLGEDGNAEHWGVDDIGACQACGHLLVVHRPWGCWACLADADVSDACRLAWRLHPERRVGLPPASRTGWSWALRRERRPQA